MKKIRPALGALNFLRADATLKLKNVDNRTAIQDILRIAQVSQVVRTKSHAGSRYSLSQWLALSLLALSLLVAVGVRVRLLDVPLERDEGEYAYMGQLILEGIPPYQLACNVKMPGIYLAYAAIMAVFGQTPAGIHLGLLVVHLATLGVFFLIARNLFGFFGAANATAAYALITLSPSYLGLATHATHFVMLLALLGVWLLLRVSKNGGLLNYFASGCSFGIAFLMKQPGMFFGFFGGLCLVWFCIAGKIAWRQTLMRLGLYSFGCLLPLLAVCLWLKIAGVFPQFWFWTIIYPRDYVTAIPFDVGMQDARNGFGKIFHSAPLLCVIAGVGLAYLCDTRLALKTRIFLAGFLFFSLLAVCPGFYFRAHYFLLLAPAIALLAGFAISWSFWLATKYSLSWISYLILLIAAVACAQSLYADRAVLFSLSPRQACRAVYGMNPFPESLDVASYIEQNTQKNQRIAIMGDEPQIYFYSHRHSSTTQIYPSQTMDSRPYAREMQKNIIHEVEQNPPEYLVLFSLSKSWLVQPDSSRLLFDWLPVYLKQNMQPVGLIQFTSPQTTETVWGTNAATTPLSSPYFILVFKRAASR